MMGYRRSGPSESPMPLFACPIAVWVVANARVITQSAADEASENRAIVVRMLAR